MTATVLQSLVRTMYQIPVLNRVAQKIHHTYGKYPGNPVMIADYDGDLKMMCELHDHISSTIFWRGYYSKNELDCLGTMLTTESVFVDVGANIGVFTLFAAKRAKRVIAYEPYSPNFLRLKKNVELNGMTNVILNRSALGSRVGTTKIYCPDLSQLGGATMYPSEGGDYEDVSMTTLDESLAKEPRVDVIKIDAEGAELEILKGAKETIEKHRPKIIVELNDETCRLAGYKCDDIVTYLILHGYSVRPVVIGSLNYVAFANTIKKIEGL